MSVLQLTFGCGPSDKVAAIFDGRVPHRGLRAIVFPDGPEEAFHRAFANQDFDITELSASSLILATARGQKNYYTLPVVPIAHVPHSAFYVRTDRGIRSPQDLPGN